MLFDSDNILNIFTLIQQGQVLVEKRHYEPAVPLFEQALLLSQQQQRLDTQLLSIEWLVRAQLAMADYSQAITYLAKLPSDKKTWTFPLLCLGIISYWAEEQLELVEGCLLALVNILEHTTPHSLSPEITTVFTELISFFANNGEFSLAIDCLYHLWNLAVVDETALTEVTYGVWVASKQGCPPHLQATVAYELANFFHDQANPQAGGLAVLYFKEVWMLMTGHGLTELDNGVALNEIAQHYHAQLSRVHPQITTLKGVLHQLAQTTDLTVQEGLITRHAELFLSALAEYVFQELHETDEILRDTLQAVYDLRRLCLRDGIADAFAGQRTLLAWEAQYNNPTDLNTLGEYLQNILNEDHLPNALADMLNWNHRLVHPCMLFCYRNLMDVKIHETFVDVGTLERMQETYQLLKLYIDNPEADLEEIASVRWSDLFSDDHSSAYLFAHFYVQKLYQLREKYDAIPGQSDILYTQFSPDLPQLRHFYELLVDQLPNYNHDMLALLSYLPNVGGEPLQNYLKPREYAEWCRYAAQAAQIIGHHELWTINTTHIGDAYLRMGDLDQAEYYYQKAMRAGFGVHGEIPIAMINLPNIYAQRGDLKRAIALCQDLLALHRDKPNAENEINIQVALVGFYIQNGQLPEALVLANQVQPQLESLADERGLGVLFSHLSALYVSQGDYQSTQDYTQRFLVIAKRRQEHDQVQLALDRLGQIATHRQDYPEALGFFQEALQIAQAHNLRQKEAITSHNLAGLYQKLGDYPQAIQFLETSKVLFEAMGNQETVAQCQQELALLHHLQQEAITPPAEAPPISNIPQSPSKIENLLPSQAYLPELNRILLEAVTYQKQGNGAKALTIYLQAIPRLLELRLYAQLADVSLQAGLLLIQLGNHKTALHHLQQGLQYGGQSLRLQQALEYQNALAVAYDYLGKSAEAVTHYQHALNLAIQQSEPDILIQAYYNLGQAYAKDNQLSLAHNSYETGLSLAKTQNKWFHQGTFLASIGMLYERQRQYPQACPYYKQALTIFRTHQHTDSVNRLTMMLNRLKC